MNCPPSSDWRWILVCLTAWVPDLTPHFYGWHESKNWIVLYLEDLKVCFLLTRVIQPRYNICLAVLLKFYQSVINFQIPSLNQCMRKCLIKQISTSHKDMRRIVLSCIDDTKVINNPSGCHPHCTSRQFPGFVNCPALINPFSTPLGTRMACQEGCVFKGETIIRVASLQNEV